MKIKLLVTPLLCLALLAPLHSEAASLEGQSFEDGVHLASRELRLNGLGLRAVMFIKGYVAGLYLGERASSLQEVSDMPGPKRLQLRMLRAAGPDDFNNALVSGIRKHSSPDELARLQERVGQLERTINTIGQTVKGDVINFDYVPDLGTTLTVNGTSKGVPIAGADFYVAVLGIFLGDHPVDKKLKQGLLGQ